MHSLVAQIGFRVAAEVVLAVLAPILGFLWWRLGFDVRAARWAAWRQKTGRRLFGVPKPEVFYRDAKGRTRKYKPRWLAVFDGVLATIALSFAALMVICFLDLARQSPHPVTTTALVLFASGSAALYIRAIIKG